jgi:enterochelin esterase-like enzyme
LKGNRENRCEEKWMRFYDHIINESAPGAKQTVPAVTNVPSAEYPRVYADGRVTFRVHLPEAKSVQLEGGQGLCEKPMPLTRDAEGNWSVTLPPRVMGFHYYWFNVDGARMNDPGSETFFGYGRETSGIEIPDAQQISSDLVTAPVIPFYAPHAGAHGQLEEKWYSSKITGNWRRCYVYTPPGYDDAANATTKYPVLYLQHGAGENETGWGRQGGVNFIMDNSILGNTSSFFAFMRASVPKAKPMIVVMDNGYATYSTPGSEKRDPSEDFAFPGTEAFGAVMVQELIPMIDGSYRTLADRDHRAMAGLSMGGNQTMAITLSHLDLFSYIGTFSGAQFMRLRPRPGMAERPPFDPKTSYHGIFADAASFNSKVLLLWMGAGTAELALSASTRENVAKLHAAGIKVTEYHSPGTAHEWQTWRLCLNKFAPLLFEA